MDNKYREEVLNNFEWRTKIYNSKSITDITVSKVSDGRINIIFRNGTEKKITSTGYITFCFHKNRILFRESDQYEGFKITGRSNRNTRNIQPKMRDSLDLAFIGDYDKLQYDEFLELYYVEKKV